MEAESDIREDVTPRHRVISIAHFRVKWRLFSVCFETDNLTWAALELVDWFVDTGICPTSHVMWSKKMVDIDSK
jgi:hypothetical protein